MRASVELGDWLRDMELPSWSTVRVEEGSAPGTAALVLDRPGRLNALSFELLGELIEACRWLDDAEHVRTVVVRGEGRAFSAGFDLDDFRRLSGQPGREGADIGRRAADALGDVRPLTIAAVHGHCVGGGLVLAAACDLRVASSSARFSIPEVDLGIPFAWGGIPRLVRELGPAITKELVLTCRPFGADEAMGLRFLNRVVDDDELIAAAEALAERIAAQPWFAVRDTLQHVDAVMDDIAGTAHSAGDADTLVAALLDDESRAASHAYLTRR